MNRLTKNGNMGMRAAAIFQFSSKYVSLGAQLLITAVLARLITPEDFGLVAIVTVFTGLFTLFSNMGVSTAIVQFRDLTNQECGSIFGFSILLSLLLTALFCAISPAIAFFYSDDRLVKLCLCSSPVLLFNTLNMVPNGLILKAKRFDLIAIRLVVATAISGLFGIGAALAGAGASAIVLQSVMSAAIVFVWNFICQPARHINFHFIAPLRRIFSYSAFQFGFSFINYFSRNLDNMLIGGFLGSAQLGYYDKAYKLTTYPMNASSGVIGSIIQPFMAEHQDDKQKIFDCWMRIEKFLSLVGAVVAATFFCCSYEIVEVFYGPGWESATPVFGVLSISVYFQMMGNTAGAFYQSLGHTDYLFVNGIINSCITFVGLFVGLVIGSTLAVAYGVAVAYCLHSIVIIYFLIYRSFKKTVACLGVFIPEVVAGIIAIVVCTSIFQFVELPLLASLGVKLCIVLGIMGLAYWCTGQMVHIKSILKRN